MSKYGSNIPLSFNPTTDNPELYEALAPIHQAIKSTQYYLDQFTGASPQEQELWSQLTPAQSLLTNNANRLYVKATEDIPAGAMVNLYNSSGLKARNASAAALTTLCKAYATGTIQSGDFGEVIVMHGVVVGITGLVPGTTYYLSDTAGYISSSPGTNTQKVGFALAADTLYFKVDLL